MTALRLERGLSVGQLARRYGCTSRTVKRWALSGGPQRRDLAAAVCLHAFQLSTGDFDMRHVPSPVLRALRLHKTGSVSVIARDVAHSYGVTAAQLRSGSRRVPLPDARRAVAEKAARWGVSNAAIARELGIDAARVSRLVGGAS